ncbi:hypothetical protein [Streptomyces sp. SP18CS02]|uniref:hypothetical protein n=1 Tax=Streptomyces sp. SP18CS02 TaxID=3002531 RepID=UPI002E77F014|nr:hypothetical protein [Streptomyces sp. SP18CS02]MEE1754644.1 hypothetical protein [Streptomyces sp. SP18CS02]
MRREDKWEAQQEEVTGPAGERGLTTEDLAHPTDGAGASGDTQERGDAVLRPDGDAGEPDMTDRGAEAVYPGEATAGWGNGGDSDIPDAAGRDRAAEADETDARPDASRPGGEDEDHPLLSQEEADGFRSTWGEIQGQFVDDPRDAVRSADALVAEVMQTLATNFSSHKQGLEGQWDRGEEVPTEDLRLALQRYRSFFNRLLST